MNPSTKANPSCRSIQAALLDRFDQRQLSDPSPELADHLQACENCRAVAQELRALESGLLQAPDADPGESFWPNFLPSVRMKMQDRLAGKAKDRSWLPSLTTAGIMTAFLIISPARLSPPTWWLASQIAAEDTPRVTMEDYGVVEQILTPGQISGLEMDELDLELIESFSLGSESPVEGPLDILASWGDAAVDELLDRLKSQSIIRS
jgi:hypothetical protein